MDDNRLLEILAQEPKEDDAIVMILSNFTDYGHTDLGGMISVKQFQKVAEFLIKWREAKTTTSESALPISDVVLSEAELLCSCGKPSDSPLCFDCFSKGLERDGAK